MNKTEKLLAIYKDVLLLNSSENYSLSGSLALEVQGVKTRRESKDIDIHSSVELKEFIPCKGINEVDSESFDENYEEDKIVERRMFTYAGVTIDLYREITGTYRPATVTVSGIKCINKLDILRKKLEYILNNSVTAKSTDKHLTDLMHIISNR